MGHEGRALKQKLLETRERFLCACPPEVSPSQRAAGGISAPPRTPHRTPTRSLATSSSEEGGEPWGHGAPPTLPPSAPVTRPRVLSGHVWSGAQRGGQGLAPSWGRATLAPALTRWAQHLERKVTIIRPISGVGKLRHGGLTPLARVPQPASGSPGCPEPAWGHPRAALRCHSAECLRVVVRKCRVAPVSGCGQRPGPAAMGEGRGHICPGRRACGVPAGIRSGVHSPLYLAPATSVVNICGSCAAGLRFCRLDWAGLDPKISSRCLFCRGKWCEAPVRSRLERRAAGNAAGPGGGGGAQRPPASSQYQRALGGGALPQQFNRWLPAQPLPLILGKNQENTSPKPLLLEDLTSSAPARAIPAVTESSRSRDRASR